MAQTIEPTMVEYENAFIGPFGKKRRILFERMQQMALEGFKQSQQQQQSSTESEAVLHTPESQAPPTTTEESLPIMMIAKRPGKNFRCDQCNKEFTQRRNYEYHKSKHEGTMQFAGTCPICSKTFSNKDYLSSHMKIHCNSREYKCEWCSKSFNQRTAYNMHVRIHTGYKPHVCQICTKAFSRKGILRLHLKTHLEKRVYICKTCEKSFTNESNMRKHESVHGEYACEVCHKTFMKAHLLKTHMKDHANVAYVGAHRCPQCGASFHNSTRLKSHTKKCIKHVSTDPGPSAAEPAAGSSVSSSSVYSVPNPSGPPRILSLPTLRMPLMSRPTVIRTARPGGSNFPTTANPPTELPPVPGTLKYPYVGFMRLPQPESASTSSAPTAAGATTPGTETAASSSPSPKSKKRDVRHEERCE